MICNRARLSITDTRFSLTKVAPHELLEIFLVSMISDFKL